MQLQKLPFELTNQFSSLFLNYINQKEEVGKFCESFPGIENTLAKAAKREFSEENRNVLCKVLTEQYKNFTISDKVQKNIDSLSKKNTYTITTGHQLNLFTGPLYSILKIATIIDACKRLNNQQPGLNFVPVFWMASEDHDVEEINHFHLFGKKLTWETEQKGPVGRFSTDGIDKIFSEIKDKLPLQEQAYLLHKNYGDATRYLLNELFGAYGLVILDGDHKELKQLCIPVFKKELTQRTSQPLVNKTTEELGKLGYEGQVYAREINLFYMQDGLRERIVLEENEYKVLNTDIHFSEEEILRELNENSERFSPNVILRPVYQESILPNVIYCGGPAEICYWLQLKSVFEDFKVSFPVLLPRVFAMIIQKTQVAKLEKVNLNPEELFQEEYILKKKIVSEISSVEFNLENESTQLDKLFDEIKNKASVIDPTLESVVLAEGQKVRKIVEQIEKRLKKAEEQKHEIVLSQLSNLKSKLFPGGSLQERKDNFLNFSIQNPSFVDDIIKGIDAFDFRFNIFIEN